MDTRVRKLLFEPLEKNTLSAIVPDFTVVFADARVSAPAQLVRQKDVFMFMLHFNTGDPPPELRALLGGFIDKGDYLTVHGQINGELAFRCDDIPPPSTMTSRSRGTSTVTLRSHRMNLVAEGSDKMTFDEVKRLIDGSTEKEGEENESFYAHLIYHGPKLHLEDAGTEVRTINDFLGEAVSSQADTHQFAGAGWEGALIQKDSELHLHLRSIPDTSADFSTEQIVDLIDRVNQAVGFVLGCQPWPAYREVRLNHQIYERWLRPQFGLSTIYLVPVSASMGSHFCLDKENPIHSIIPTIANGLGGMANEDNKKLTTLLWHFRSANIGDLPPSTRLLMLCAVLDGLMKLIAGARDPKNAATDKTWKEASDKLGFSWDRWTKDIFETWGRHRHLLAHGWLWLGEELNAQEFFTDHAQLGCAFLTFVAAYCGYDGPILADPFGNKIITIRDIKEITA